MKNINKRPYRDIAIKDWDIDYIQPLGDIKIFIGKRGEIVVQDFDEIQDYQYIEIMSDKQPTLDVGEKGRQMKLLMGDKPNELNFNRAKLNLELLSLQEETITTQIRSEYHNQIDVAKNLLRQIRSEVGDADPNSPSNVKNGKRQLVQKHWQQLVSQIKIAEAYCV